MIQLRVNLIGFCMLQFKDQYKHRNIFERAENQFIYNSQVQQQSTSSMIKEKHTSKSEAEKNIPSGCFSVQLIKSYIFIKNYILTKDMFNIVTPVRYQFFHYVIVKSKNSKEGQFLQLYHQQSKRLILKAFSKINKIGTKFIVICPNSNQIVARVRGDLLGNHFYVFDGGNNPKKNITPFRRQLVYLHTLNNDFFNKKPLNVSAILTNNCRKKLDDKQLDLFQSQGMIQLQKGSSQLLNAFKQNSKKVYKITSVQPQYCKDQKQYTLNFKNLITEASSINMIMKTMTNEQCIIMGKRSQNTYSLFIGYPLTLLQGFGLFLACFVLKKQ